MALLNAVLFGTHLVGSDLDASNNAAAWPAQCALPALAYPVCNYAGEQVY